MHVDTPKEGDSPFKHLISDRVLWLEIFRPLFDALGCDIYGKLFENDTFVIRPYCWCDKLECGQCGEIETEANFLHKPSGLAVRWYKYAFRNTYTNSKDVKPSELRALVEECVRSLGLVDIKPKPLQLEIHRTDGAKGGVMKPDNINNQSVAPELKPFFKTPYFIRQKQKAKVFETIFKESTGLLTPGVHHKASKAYHNEVFDRVSFKCRSIGITIKKRQWKKYIKLMRGGYGHPMNTAGLRKYADKLTRRGYSMTTVVKALNACQRVKA